jgi:hypothetical protein
MAGKDSAESIRYGFSAEILHQPRSSTRSRTSNLDVPIPPVVSVLSPPSRESTDKPILMMWSTSFRNYRWYRCLRSYSTIFNYIYIYFL